MESCSCSTNPTLFFACSGGSNVGQIANDACRQLASEGHGKLSCLAGIGGHISGLVESAKAATKVVAIDGCGVKCAQKAFEEAKVPYTHHIVLTDWGIEKNPSLFPSQDIVSKTKERILAIVEE